MDGLTLVTNNAEAIALADDSIKTIMVSGSPIDVLNRVCEMLRNGYRLISTPLPPNVSMMRSPFRSLLIMPSEVSRDASGIEATLRAIDVIERQRKISTFAGKDAVIISDYAMIDIEYVKRAAEEYGLLRELSAEVTQ